MVLAVAVILGGTFFVLHERNCGADLGSRIDTQLEGDLAEFEASPAASATTPAELRAGSRRFVDSQAYHPDSRHSSRSRCDDGGSVVTNSEELIESEQGGGEPGGENLDEPAAQPGHAN